MVREDRGSWEVALGAGFLLRRVKLRSRCELPCLDRSPHGFRSLVRRALQRIRSKVGIDLGGAEGAMADVLAGSLKRDAAGGYCQIGP